MRERERETLPIYVPIGSVIDVRWWWAQEYDCLLLDIDCLLLYEQSVAVRRLSSLWNQYIVAALAALMLCLGCFIFSKRDTISMWSKAIERRKNYNTRSTESCSVAV